MSEHLDQLRRVMSDDDRPMRVLEHRAEPRRLFDGAWGLRYPLICVVCARYGVNQPIQRRGLFRRWKHVR